MKIKQFRELEIMLLDIFLKIESRCPELIALTFDIARCNSNNGRLSVDGYYHEGNEAELFYSIEDLDALVASKTILFQQFDHVLS